MKFIYFFQMKFLSHNFVDTNSKLNFQKAWKSTSWAQLYDEDHSADSNKSSENKSLDPIYSLACWAGSRLDESTQYVRKK